MGVWEGAGASLFLLLLCGDRGVVLCQLVAAGDWGHGRGVMLGASREREANAPKEGG